MRFSIGFILTTLLPLSLARAAAAAAVPISGPFDDETLAITPSLLRGNRLVADVKSPTATGVAAVANDQVMANNNKRSLQASLVPPSFVPLACNAVACANGQMTWKQFAPQVITQRVVIPCGVCITMNYDQNDLNGNINTDGYYLRLPKGLEIQGSLTIPDNNQYRLTIETPSVVVQGTLIMNAASSTVTGKPLIRFLMTGSENVFFTPLGANSMGCAVANSSGQMVAGNCTIGPKSFVVAGGRIDVRGLPATCKTWVKLKDVAAKPLTSQCAASNLILNGDAQSNGTSMSPNALGRGFGSASSTARLSIITVDNNPVFRIHGRASDKDSIIQNLASHQCFAPGTHFNLTARVQLNSTTPITSKMGYRIYHRRGTSLMSYGVVAATCPPSNKNWVQCGAEFTFKLQDPTILPESIEQVKLYFETVNGPTVSMLVDDWKLQVLRGPRTTLLVPAAGVTTCWGNGTEILVTSHTTNMDDAQVRRLVKAPYSMAGDNGLVRLDLDTYINPPTTALQDDGFEVEVALLSRNIVLEGARDETDKLLGGHFMVMNTPDVVQVVEGIEFNNFGRQGTLGRYPLHFHLCQNTPSLISKNLIRNSNQRCIVIHGTHNTTISNNVAFNTSGHCFITEDGGELDNKFEYNLGATTKAPIRLPKPGESDMQFPSTFWISNPSNEFVGNVAAGSKSAGFWFELAESVQPPTLYFSTSAGMNPRKLPLKKFVDNVAHSNSKGMRTYPNGMHPAKTCIFKNWRAYKNSGGILSRATNNFVFEGGVLADNELGAFIDNTVNYTLDGMKIVGISDRFKEIIATQGASYSHDEIVGIQLELTHHGATGLNIKNVEFSGFEDTNNKTLIKINPTSEGPEWGIIETKVQNITVPDGMDPIHFNFYDAVNENITGLYLIDIDSSMNPGSGSIQGASTVIANSVDMKAFVNMSLCDSFPQYGYLYCKQTCLRTITFAIDPAETDGVLLRMTDARNHSFLYRGMYAKPETTEFGNTEYDNTRVFSAALPPGSYTAEYVHTPTGKVMWPSFVETTYKPALCGNALANNAVQVVRRVPTTAECANLIRNGNMEASSTDYPYWLHREAGIAIAPGRGLNGTKAIVTVDSSSSDAYIAQYIDNRCLERGAMYDVQAWVRLELMNGNVMSCNGGADDNCPVLQLRMKTADGKSKQLAVAEEFVQGLTNSGNNGWNLLQGTITITADLASASAVWLAIERNRANVKMLVDGVSMQRINQNCNELVSNGEFALGTSIFWSRSKPSSNLAISTNSQGNHSLQLSSRTSGFDAIQQKIATGCMVSGEMYLAKAKIRVLNPTGTGSFDCNPVAVAGTSNACPRMRLQSTVDSGSASEDSELKTIAETEHGTIPSTNGEVWHTMSGIFLASDFDEESDETILMIDGPSQLNRIVVDSVSITPLALSCSELIRNGNAEAGPTAQFWDTATSNTNVKIKVVEMGSSTAHGFYISGRSGSSDSLAQMVDPRCMQASSTWTLSAQMKLVSSGTGVPTSCEVDYNPLSIACPLVIIKGYSNGNMVEEQSYRITDQSLVWTANAMNNFVVKDIQVSGVLAACDKIIISFRFNPTWELLIDNISMTPFS